MTIGPLPDNVERIVALAAEPSTSNLDSLRAALVALLDSAKTAPRTDLDVAVARLSEPIAVVGLPHAGALALGCGALVELGADVGPMAQPTLSRLEEAVEKALPFVEACIALKQEGAAPVGEHEGQPQDAISLFGGQVGERMPDNRQAHWALGLLNSASLTVLSRSKALRKVVRGRTAFVGQVRQLEALGAAPTCLSEMLQVLDDEVVIVLHPAQQRGYEIVISGIGNNFQLHTLLAGALIGDPERGWLQGDRPAPEEVAYAKDAPIVDPDELPSAHGFFNLWNWTGLQPDGQLPDGYKEQAAGRAHWIWNEGVPADIVPFGGKRIILLGPPPYPRSWNGGRFFPEMIGEFVVTRQFEDNETITWLDRIAHAPKPTPTGHHVMATDISDDYR